MRVVCLRVETDTYGDGLVTVSADGGIPGEPLSYEMDMKPAAARELARLLLAAAAAVT